MIGRTISAFTALLSIWLGQVALAQVSAEDRLAAGQPPLVVVHRSAVLDGHPENTLAWIEAGIARGVDMLNVNPQRTSDGQYVLMHDPTLNRMTDVVAVFPEGAAGGPSRAQRAGKDYVADFTLAEIKRLQSRNAEGGDGHPVPTLSEAITLVDGRALLLLGLKSYDVESLSAILRQHDTRNLVLFELYYSGTDQSRLRALAESSGVVVAVSLFRSTDYLGDLEKVHAQLGSHLRLVSVARRGVTPEFLARIESLGLHLMISGWKTGEDYALAEDADPEPWKKVLDMGYSVFTDQPDGVLTLMGR